MILIYILPVEVTAECLTEMFEKGKKNNIETRGISDHGFISSIYFRDPNGYVVELTAKNTDKTDNKDAFKQNPHKILEDWMRKN